MLNVKRALVSVSDKSGLVDFCKGLHEMGVEMISTGGTARAIREAGIPVKDVSEITGFPEMMDGRVKTLHPNVHGGILALRNESHLGQLKEQNIDTIDMVVVNLYPFRETVKKGAPHEDVIENIDIGGPAMLRSSAKNFRDVAIVASKDQYELARIFKRRQTIGIRFVLISNNNLSGCLQ